MRKQLGNKITKQTTTKNSKTAEPGSNLPEVSKY